MIIIKTTSDSHKTIKLIANTLLNKKYAACINIVPRMRSKYIWEGRIAESRETMLLIKTVDAMEKMYIKQLRNYITMIFLRLQQWKLKMLIQII